MNGMPDGFDPRLKTLNKHGGRLYTTIPTRLFRENVDELDALVKKFLDVEGQSSFDAKWAARQAVHKWTVDKLIELRTDKILGAPYCQPCTIGPACSGGC